MSWTTSCLTEEDEKLLQRQAQVVNDLLISLGECPLTETAKDCQRIQAILDGNVLGKADTWPLQCLGIAMGNIMVKVLGLHWIIVTDEYGRDPALQFQNTSLIIYPLTMISKRVERSEPVDVSQLLSLTATHVKQLGHEVA